MTSGHPSKLATIGSQITLGQNKRGQYVRAFALTCMLISMQDRHEVGSHAVKSHFCTHCYLEYCVHALSARQYFEQCRDTSSPLLLSRRNDKRAASIIEGQQQRRSVQPHPPAAEPAATSRAKPSTAISQAEEKCSPASSRARTSAQGHHHLVLELGLQPPAAGDPADQPEALQ